MTAQEQTAALSPLASIAPTCGKARSNYGAAGGKSGRLLGIVRAVEISRRLIETGLREK